MMKSTMSIASDINKIDWLDIEIDVDITKSLTNVTWVIKAKKKRRKKGNNTRQRFFEVQYLHTQFKP